MTRDFSPLIERVLTGVLADNIVMNQYPFNNYLLYKNFELLKKDVMHRVTSILVTLVFMRLWCHISFQHKRERDFRASTLERSGRKLHFQFHQNSIKVKVIPPTLNSLK